jgi:hypothetical protein
MYTENVYEQACKQILTTLQISRDLRLESKEIERLQETVAFVSKAVIHDYTLCCLPLEDQIRIVLSLVIPLHSQFLEACSSKVSPIKDLNSASRKTIAKLEKLHEYLNTLDADDEYLRVSQEHLKTLIFNMCKNTTPEGFTNLLKSHP